MSAAQAADQLAASQEKLELDLRSSASTGPTDAAAAQRSVADAIAKMDRDREASLTAAARTGDDPNWRNRAAQAFLNVQVQLSAMPQLLTAVQSAVTAKRDADARLRDARGEAETASPDRKEAADRAAEQAAQDAADAAEHLARVLDPLRRTVGQLAGALETFDPEATAARELIAGSLASALQLVEQTARAGDMTSLERAAADARQAIDVAQSQLARRRIQSCSVIRWYPPNGLPVLPPNRSPARRPI